ncbi:hypothetical protein QNE44_002117 [Vibrio harveyi]|nr:hypothetical protein [Vibrio harveyi]
MDRLAVRENFDELQSDSPVDWLTQEPVEITSHWIPNEYGINEELV